MVAVVDFKKICLEERKSDKPEFKPYEIFSYFDSTPYEDRNQFDIRMIDFITSSNNLWKQS